MDKIVIHDRDRVVIREVVVASVNGVGGPGGPVTSNDVTVPGGSVDPEVMPDDMTATQLFTNIWVGFKALSQANPLFVTEVHNFVECPHDGTATSFDIMEWVDIATGWTSPVTIDLASLVGLMTMWYGADTPLTFAIPSQGKFYRTTMSTITEPWEPLNQSYVGMSMPNEAVGRTGSILIRGGPFGIELLGQPVPVLDTPIAGFGILQLADTLGQWATGYEGILDRWRFPVAVTDDPGFDPTPYIGTPTPDVDQPAMYGGLKPFANSNAWVLYGTHCGCYQILGDGSWLRYEHPAIFDPPGNGFRVTLNGIRPDGGGGFTIDPASGTMWTCIDAQATAPQRASSLHHTDDPNYRWSRTDPSPLDAVAALAASVSSDLAGKEDIGVAQTLVDAAVSALLGGAPALALDTIKELADRLAEDGDALAAILVTLADKLDTATFTAAIASLATDSAVVHKTGTETIAGVKTFSSVPQVPNGASGQDVVNFTQLFSYIAFYVNAEAALARDASNLTSGTVADARIPSSVTRDSELTAGLATKEDVGVAATLIAAEPELDDGYGTILDTSVPGFVSIKRATNKLATAVTSVSNTTTETTVLAAAVALSAEDRVFTTTFDLVLSGQYTNNSGSNKDVTFRVKLAGATIMTFGFTAIPTSATARAFTLRASFGFQNFIGSRAQGMGVMTLGAAGAGLDFGGISKAADTTPTFTLGSAISLDVTAQHSAAATTVIALGLGGSIRRGSD